MKVVCFEVDDNTADDLMACAIRQDLGPAELLRRFIKLGITIEHAVSDPRHRVLLQEHYNSERLFTEKELTL